MLSKKRLLLGLVAVAVMLVGGITAGTSLLIDQPASMTVSIEDLGSSPTFDLIDNPSDTTAGGKTGTIEDDDTYTMQFGPGGADVVFGRNQAVTVGSTSDSIFTVENNYAKGLVVRLVAVDPDDGGPPVGGNGFYFHLYSPTIAGDSWPYHYIGIWAQTYNRLGSQGAHWLPAGESRDYYMKYTTYGGAAQPEQSFTMELKLQATENEEPLMVWAENNLPANDCLFDDVNEIVYHKLVDGSSVEAIPFADFDHEAWLASWPTD